MIQRVSLAALFRGLVILLLAFAVPRAAMADLAGEMNNMFNSMAVATPPAVFNTAMRGVLSGGGVAVNNRIVNANIVSIVPPGFRAGCGGIDLFAGSFSFINAAQFEALLKSIASNAIGYAFEVAMNAMCPTCMSTIETLARKLQQDIERLSNSCQMAQGLVNDVASGFQQKDATKASLINMATGAAQDAFDSFSSLLGPAPPERAVNASPTQMLQQITGNVTWRALNSQNATAWFNSGDTSLLEVLMNIGGTVIVAGMADDLENAGLQQHQINAQPGRPDLIDSLINGGQINLAVCDTTDQDGCLNPTQGTVTLTGFTTMVLNAFEGVNAAGGGIIDKAASKTPLTGSEQNIIGLLPCGIGGLIFRLASKSPAAAKALIETAAPQVGLLLAEALTRDMFRAVQAAVSVSQDTHAPEAAKIIQSSFEAARSEELLLQSRYGSLPQIAAEYQSLMGIVQPLPRGLGAMIVSSGAHL